MKKEGIFIIIKNSRKFIPMLLLSFLIIISFSARIFASPVQPYYSDTNRTQITLSFSSGKAICSGTIIGKKDTKSISDCTITLSDSNGNIVSSWSDLSSRGNVLNFYKSSSSVTKGETYTLSVSAYVNRNGSSEHVTDSISKKY